MAILDHAARIASQVGLSGISIGQLANDLSLSKSGLFAHFQSKETLQIQVLEAAAERFVQEVVRPALAAPRGVTRLAALFEQWLAWAKSQETPGGCLFVAAAVEWDDRPGPVRDTLVRLQREWLDVIANVVQTAVATRELRAGTDALQFANDLHGVMLGYHHASRLLKDPRADARAHVAFENLVAAGRRGQKRMRPSQRRRPS
jgi:AcrR family transcriptional regulator